MTARADREVANPAEIIAELKTGVLPQLQADYPGLTYDLEGEQREHAEGLAVAQVGLFGGAGADLRPAGDPLPQLRQPLLVMSAIPFGVIGAVLRPPAAGLQHEHAQR